MRIIDIEYVRMIALYKNFSKAASMLHISQPALSQGIQKLEQELGCKLFDRRKNDLKLTSDGEIFVQEGKKILELHAELLDHLSSNSSLRSGRVIVGASPMYSKHYFPYIYSNFSKSYPQINLRLIEDLGPKLWKRLCAHEIDLAITAVVSDEKNIAVLPLYKEKVVLAVPLETMQKMKNCLYRKDGQEYANLECFANEKFVSYLSNNSMYNITNLLCQEAGFMPDVVFYSSDPEILGAMVACGMGVGFLPSLATVYNHAPDRVCYLNIESSLSTRDYMIAYNKDEVLNHACKCFIELSQTMHARKEFHHNYDCQKKASTETGQF